MISDTPASSTPKWACTLQSAITILLLIACLLPILAGCAKEDDNPEPPTDTAEYGYGFGKTLPQDMPTLSITTENSEEITSKTTYLQATVSLSESLGEFSFNGRSAKVRCRGNYTYWGVGVERKSFRLKFDQKQDMLGLGNGASRNWCLLANWCDRSMLRDQAAFAMASLLRFSFSTDSTFVAVTVNGEYRGVYLLCEHPTINDRRINITEDAETLDSDYLIELDGRSHQTGTEGVDYFVSDGKEYAVKNDSIHPDAIQMLKEYFDAMNEAIQSGDRDRITEYIDVDSFVDMYILQEFTMNADCGFASLYFVKKGNGKLSMTFPWDFDLAFGNYGILGDGNWDVLYAGTDEYAPNSNPIFYRLMATDWFSDLVSARWKEVGKNLRDRALYEIDRIVSVYSDEIAYNYKVFPTLGTSFSPIPSSVAKLDTYEKNVEQLKHWIRKRYQFLDDAIG